MKHICICFICDIRHLGDVKTEMLEKVQNVCKSMQ